MERNKKQALYPRPERRGFTAQLVNYRRLEVHPLSITWIPSIPERAVECALRALARER